MIRWFVATSLRQPIMVLALAHRKRPQWYSLAPNPSLGKRNRARRVSKEKLLTYLEISRKAWYTTRNSLKYRLGEYRAD